MDNRFRLSIIDSTPAYVEEIGEYETGIEDIVNNLGTETIDAFIGCNIQTAIASRGEEELEITIVETKKAYYININTGLGWCGYDKEGWTMYRAAKDQCFDMFDN